jgi:HK97 family phage prohead protease
MPEQRIHTGDLTRQIDDPDLFRLATADDDDGLTIEGYWAVLNSPTIIDSWEGTFKEQSAPGAFKRTLRERTPIMQFDHGSHPLLGSLPLGQWTERMEDDHGAFSRGRLSDNWLVLPFRDAIRDGGVKGMSYRFRVLQEVWTEPDGKRVKPEDAARRIYTSGQSEDELLLRTIKESRVSEAGPVVWPAYEATEVGVRSKVTIDLGRLHEPSQRAELARAVMLADDLERTTTDDDDPPGSSTPAEHSSETPDAPQASADAPGEHAQATTPPTDSRAVMRAQLRELREYVTTIKKGASHHGGS